MKVELDIDKHLVSFGNYILSDRQKSPKRPGFDGITHADLENWKHKEGFNDIELTSTDFRDNTTIDK